MTACQRRQAGVALVLVIWVLTLLLAISGSFLYATRTDAAAAKNTLLIARAEAVAWAAVARAALEAFKPANARGAWKRGPYPVPWQFDGMALRVVVGDEAGKIDINTANNALLSAALERAGLTKEEVARALDAILDWRDPDSFRRPNGAEEPEYATAGLSWRPANGPFQSIEELQLVLGIRPDVYLRLAPMITVYSRQSGVNPHFASKAALLAIPAVTEEQVDAYLAERRAAFEDGRPLPAFLPAGPYANYAPSRAVSVGVVVELGSGSLLSREAVVAPTPQFPGRPLAVLAFRPSFNPASLDVASEGGAVGR